MAKAGGPKRRCHSDAIAMELPVAKVTGQQGGAAALVLTATALQGQLGDDDEREAPVERLCWLTWRHTGQCGPIRAPDAEVSWSAT